MYDFSFGYVIMAFAVGITLSTIVYEKWGLLSGGIIIPSIFALFMNKPIYIFSTLLLVVFTNEVINYMKKHIILYGRRLYSVVLLTGITLSLLTMLFMKVVHAFKYGIYLSNPPVMKIPFFTIELPQMLLDLGLGAHYVGYVIGILIVPVITNDVQIQGYKSVFATLLSVSLITYLILILFI